MKPEDFTPDNLPTGQKTRLTLDAGPLPSGELLQLSLLAARGARPGPTLAVLGGVHGDEYEGMAAARAVMRDLDPGELAGTVLSLPVCNPPAFAARARCTPHDGLNMARVFPGRPDGAPTERMAHAITLAAANHADFLIDLHSSGSYIAMPLLIGCYHAANAAGRASSEAARRFGLPLVWYHGEEESTKKGRSMSEPHTRGVPWLYTECPSGGWLHPEYAALYAQGVVSVMRYLNMLPGAAPPIPGLREIFGAGDLDTSLTAPVAGFLVPQVNLLQEVQAGQTLGVIEDPAGELLAEVQAPAAGTVMMRRNTPSVAAGEIIFLLA